MQRATQSIETKPSRKQAIYHISIIHIINILTSQTYQTCSSSPHLSSFEAMCSHCSHCLQASVFNNALYKQLRTKCRDPMAPCSCHCSNRGSEFLIALPSIVFSEVISHMLNFTAGIPPLIIYHSKSTPYHFARPLSPVQNA